MKAQELAYFGIKLAKLELHAEGDGRTMVGYATAFNFPIPGDHGETIYIREGALAYTLKHAREKIQVLYHHGRDPQIGEKPLGVPKTLEPDRTGLWTETPLARTSYNEEIIIPLLESGGLRSMSIAFGATQQSWNDDHSERYIEQMALAEYGPTPFPRNLGASAALHSAFLTDEIDEWHWDGAAAMRTCSSAADFRKIAFERANDSDPDTAAHWVLPHHPNPDGAPGNADSQGVAAALAALHGGRGGPPDLKLSVADVESHLQAHQGEASSVGGSASTAGADRLTWAVKASLRLDQYAAELAEQERKLSRL